MTTVAPTQSNTLMQLRSFLLAILPDGVDVVRGQVNRVPEPQVGSFVVMTPIRQRRLKTNEDGYADAVFTGSIAGTLMTITDVDARFPDGHLAPGSMIFGEDIPLGTKVVDILSGSGQVGTYTINAALTLDSRTISAGDKQLMQAVEQTIQLDFHSDDQTAYDMALITTTVIRDGAGVELFANQDPDYGVRPLYADDPAQRPFINESQQYEWRWVVEAKLQANEIVRVPQQFFDNIDLEVISVDAAYPPA